MDCWQIRVGGCRTLHCSFDPGNVGFLSRDPGRGQIIIGIIMVRKLLQFLLSGGDILRFLRCVDQDEKRLTTVGGLLENCHRLFACICRAAHRQINASQLQMIVDIVGCQLSRLMQECSRSQRRTFVQPHRADPPVGIRITLIHFEHV